MLDYHLLARNRKCNIVTVISVNKPEDDSLALLKALVKKFKISWLFDKNVIIICTSISSGSLLKHMINWFIFHLIVEKSYVLCFKTIQ